MVDFSTNPLSQVKYPLLDFKLTGAPIEQRVMNGKGNVNQTGQKVAQRDQGKSKRLGDIDSAPDSVLRFRHPESTILKDRPESMFLLEGRTV
jgi:hypothetical protein